jgi:hypothetical protein
LFVRRWRITINIIDFGSLTVSRSYESEAMNISIRTATSEDAIAIGELFREFSDYLRSLGDTETE